MQAVFLDRASVDTGDLDLAPLRALTPHWRWYERTAAEQVAERIVDAQVVVSNKVPLMRETIGGAARLKLILVAATGTNNIDLEAARSAGIVVSNARDYATPAVVQHVFALILALTTRLLDYRQWVGQGHWQRSDLFCGLDFPIGELRGRTLGILGYGVLGRAVAEVGRAFGMDIAIGARPGGQDRRAGRVPLEELLHRSDVISLHMPLTEHTRDLIGERELAWMKPEALLINTARGAIVDESALAAALRARRIGGAGIDVLAQEPPRQGSPLLEEGVPNLIVTPHTAWASRASRQRLIDELAANLRSYLQGEPRNAV